MRCTHRCPAVFARPAGRPIRNPRRLRITRWRWRTGKRRRYGRARRSRHRGRVPGRHLAVHPAGPAGRAGRRGQPGGERRDARGRRDAREDAAGWPGAVAGGDRRPCPELQHHRPGRIGDPLAPAPAARRPARRGHRAAYRGRARLPHPAAGNADRAPVRARRHAPAERQGRGFRTRPGRRRRLRPLRRAGACCDRGGRGDAPGRADSGHSHRRVRGRDRGAAPRGRRRGRPAHQPGRRHPPASAADSPRRRGRARRLRRAHRI